MMKHIFLQKSAETGLLPCAPPIFQTPSFLSRCRICMERRHAFLREGGNDVARWGRRGWRMRPPGSFRFNLRLFSPYQRIKPVKWGSSRAKMGWTARPQPAKQNRSSNSIGTVTKKWGRRPRLTIFSLGRQRNGQGRAHKPLRWTGSQIRAPLGRGTGESGTVRHRPRMRKRKLFLFIFLIMMLMTVPAFIFIESNLREPLMNIAKVRVKQVATQAINRAITERVASDAESEKLIDWKMNADGKISGFMLNYSEHMSITSDTINTVQTTLNHIKDIPEHIPIGHALDSAVLSSFGPRVPVRFEPVGAVKVELSTRERNAAINMVLVEVYIKVIAEVSIIIPFDTEPELVETEIPISYLLVVGDVPMYYYDSSGKAIGENAPQAPNISVPLQPGAGVSTNQEERDAEHGGEGANDGSQNEAELP
ncbi:sporulation protein YunB [Paenibacillus sp. J5C_2022]|uniref:sporulation protein YunB n=1 Tax=Paenibacillus sp. J5C2022 TaxID=2977129 RepID=UPI0021D1A2A5|nr:sporulation protein YunB [Paenibacillus sp. J5C2022]MCU6710962.1 sporulation protein YunB [Paenibacillus sp. J5C2022]